jgi:hypothetical protein
MASALWPDSGGRIRPWLAFLIDNANGYGNGGEARTRPAEEIEDNVKEESL